MQYKTVVMDAKIFAILLGKVLSHMSPFGNLPVPDNETAIISTTGS